MTTPDNFMAATQYHRCLRCGAVFRFGDGHRDCPNPTGPVRSGAYWSLLQHGPHVDRPASEYQLVTTDSLATVQAAFLRAAFILRKEGQGNYDNQLAEAFERMLVKERL